MVKKKIPERGDIYYADLSPVVGSEQGGVRPVLILQNDTGNLNSPTVIIAAMTSKLSKTRIPTHVWLPARATKLKKSSIIMLEQIRTIDKHRLHDFVDTLEERNMKEVVSALKISLGLN
ncbi:type II toxin-antitoxin system PemK/MazF family toxin [Oenococcus alcoholitolerans]|uniref:type II toxin-antitoxin system PemK/MazF family toxin n=1 Tax=Oenococcus alcoholitolerans TaxID=931074 RepID=UPI003F6F68DC